VAGVLLPGALPAASRHTDIRFALYGGYTIVAQGGVGRLKNLNFIIDTGAVPSVVDQRVARKLGLAGRAEQLSVFNRNLEAQRVVLPDLALGPLRARSVDVRVTDLSAFERALGVPIAGMIGLDVLGSSDFSKAVLLPPSQSAAA
jgi:predicted aspartyl protease